MKIRLTILFLCFCSSGFSDTYICNISNFHPNPDHRLNIGGVSEFIRISETAFKQIKSNAEMGKTETIWHVIYEDNFSLVLYYYNVDVYGDKKITTGENKSLKDFKETFNRYGPPTLSILTHSKKTEGVAIRGIPLVSPYPVNGYDIAGYDQKHNDDGYKWGSLSTGKMYKSRD